MPTVTIIKPTIETESDRKIRAAAYCRVSSNSDDQLNSYMAQMTYYTHKFENSETEMLVDLYADEGISGTREDKRPEFQRLIKDCRKGKLDRIYTKSISRFARNTRDCLKNVRELKSLGITIFFEKENIDTANIADEMMITIMGGLAQEESVSISNNVKWSYQKRFEKGKVKAFSAPFGYDLCNGVLIVNEEQAEIVRSIYNMFLSGIGYQRIAEICRKKYSECKYKFSYHSISYILANERYIGDSLYQKTFTTDTIPFKQVINNGQMNKYHISKTHKAIISKETFETAQNLIENRRHSNITSEYAFKGKISCGICGSKYKRKICRNKAIWVCRKHDNLADSCDSKRLMESDILEAFLKLINKLILNYKHILLPLQADLHDVKMRKFSTNINVTKLNREIAELREQSHVIAGLRTKGFLSEEKYRVQTADINRKIGKLQSELKLLTKSDDEDETLEQINMLTEYFENRKEFMIEFEEKAFEFLVDKIIVNKNELEFHLLGGLKFIEKI